MNTNKITGLGNPTTNSEPVTKQYGDSSYLTDGGFVMADNIGMGGHTVTNLGTPTNNTDAATKKYVDDKTVTDPNFNPSGVTMSGNIDMSDNKVTNLKPPTSDKDAATKKYVDDKTDTDPNFNSSGITMSGNIDMGNNKITNLKTPTNNKDAATKKYVDDKTGTDPNFNSSGITMSGNIDMGDNKITNLKPPTSDKDAATKKYVDDKTGTDPNFNSSGITMSGNIDMGDNKVTNVKTPTNNKDAATKKYVDDKTGTDPNFNSSGITMSGNINMGDNKITNLKTPTNNKDAATKKYVDDNTGITNPNFNPSGITMSGNIEMGNNKITNLKTPTNNKDAATKKYVDDKKCKFKDGTTTTEVVDLRYDSANNRFTFHNDIGFLKAYGTEINSSSLPATLVTLNSLQRGGLLGINSFSPTIKGLFPHRLLMAKGNVGNFTVIHKDQTVFDTNGVSLTSYASGIELEVSFKTALPNGIYKYIFDIFLTSSQSVKVFLYGECGGTGYKATTTYEHWSGTAHGTEKQNNVADGYFHRMHGTHLHFSGSFRNYGKKIINYGRASAMNETGSYNEFVLQNLTANSDEPVVLGTDMTWEFENETPGRGLTFTTDSYFYIEKVQTI